MSKLSEEFFRVEYHKCVDSKGVDYIIPTVWMGNQGFDLVEQYPDDPLSAQEKAEWFVSMFKKAINNYVAYRKKDNFK